MNNNFTPQTLVNQQSSGDSQLEKSLKNAFIREFDKLKPAKYKLNFLIDYAASLDCFNTNSMGNIEKLMN